MEIPSKIVSSFKKYAELSGEPDLNFPYGTNPDNFGGIHLEISPNGLMALVGTERGKETQRQETKSIDELMYWIFKKRANSKAFYKSQKNYDYAASQQKALNEIGKISQEWRNRLKREQENFRRS
ncbi:Imm63 family immunity protein (plasmid) [Tritonibacter scottomollicae]|uniref:Imm63 family immunity protein n=1 Tax=Tritonibacter scottomollicae TaxID=483013 RepID=A0ABZ0HM64_TRISK|nr:Imm63 family immunity protein [Tritonibacter scottomollicae]WOI35373.1 Imm63 family immunity protein [Tritonibacter scottomollicae]